MPIRTYFTDGITTMFDSDLVTGGVCLGVYTIPANVSWSKSWSLLQGTSLRVTTIWGDNALDGASTTYFGLSITGPVPTVTAQPFPYERRILVWATGTPAILNAPGMQAVNDSGVVALSPQARGLNYIGDASYSTLQASTWSGADGDLGTWFVQITSPPDAQPVPVVALTDGLYLHLVGEFVYAGSNTWRCAVQATLAAPSVPTAWPALQQPRVLCFAKPANPGAGTQCAIYDDDASLAYDLLAGRLLASSGQAAVSAGDTTARSMPISGSVGVFGRSNGFGWSGARFQRAEYATQGYIHRSGSNFDLGLGLFKVTDGEPPAANYNHSVWADSTFEFFDIGAY